MILDARRSAGLTQAQLAERAGTSQPTVARIESGGRNPTWDLVSRLLDACGLAVALERVDVAVDPDLEAQIDRQLALTVEQRMRSVGEMVRFLQSARAAGGD